MTSGGEMLRFNLKRVGLTSTLNGLSQSNDALTNNIELNPTSMGVVNTAEADYSTSSIDDVSINGVGVTTDVGITAGGGVMNTHTTEINGPSNSSISIDNSTVTSQRHVFYGNRGYTSSDDDSSDYHEDNVNHGTRVNHFPGHDSISDFDSDEDVPLPIEDTFHDRVSKWNVFLTSPWESGNEVMEVVYEVARQFFKVATYLIMMPCVLMLIVLSKGSTLIATSNLRPLRHSNEAQASPTEDPPTENNSSTWDSVSDSMQSTTTYLTSETSSFRHHDMQCKRYTQMLYTDILRPNGSYLRTDNYTEDFTKCVTIPLGFPYSYDSDDFACLNADNSSGNVTFRESYSADQCFVSRNYWAWSLMLMICVPHCFVFLRCLWRILFKKKKTPTLNAMMFVILTETLYSIGVGLMMFLVLPSLNDAVTALVLMLGVATIPSILKITIRPKLEERRPIKVTIDGLAIALQLSVIVVWPLIVWLSNDQAESHLIWSIPVSFVLVSVRWWENYVDSNSSLGRLHKPLKKLLRSIRRTRTKIMFFASLWKIGITILVMMVCVSLQVDDMDPINQVTNRWTAVFNFDISQCSSYNNDTNITTWAVAYNTLSEMELDWVWVWLVNCLSGLVCYFFARSAAKMQIQRFVYALPLVLSTPLMFGLMIGGCELWNSNPCAFSNDDLSGYLFYKCYRSGTLVNSLVTQLWFMWPLWWLSQLWITWHVWFPKSERMAKAEK